MKNCRKIFKNSEYNGTNGKRRQNVESTDKWKRMNTATLEWTKTQFEIKMLFSYFFLSVLKIVYLELIERDTEVRNLC